MPNQYPIPRSLNRANREPLTDSPVRIRWSTRTDGDGTYLLPEGLGGHYFAITAAGDVDSGGLPRAPEASTTLFNGDGYVVRLDLDDERAPRVTAKLAQTPSLFTDQISAHRPAYEFLRYENYGVSRFSPQLGMRNTVNTAFVPIAPDPEGRWTNARMLIAIDAGRPWEIDTVTLDCVTPVGSNEEWSGDGNLGLPFQTIFATAHPIWDPVRSEGFMVNFGKGLFEMPDTMASVHDAKEAAQKTQSRVRRFLDSVGLSIVGRVKDRAWRFFKRVEYEVGKEMPLGDFLPTTFMYLMRWDGMGQMQRWNLFRRGDRVPVEVVNSLHQVQVSEKHVVILDSAYQVGASSIISQPVPQLKAVDAAARDVASRAGDPFMRLYIVAKDDLDSAKGDSSGDRAEVLCTVVELPGMAMHFTLDYEEIDGRLGVTVCHSTNTSVDSFVADYDQLVVGGQAPDEGVMGMLPAAAGLSRIGRYIIDTKTGAVRHGRTVMEEPYQWETALYGATEAFTTHPIPAKTRFSWWFGFGLWPDVAIEEVLNQFDSVVQKFTTRQHVLEELKQGGAPSSLFRFDDENVAIVDGWILDEYGEGGQDERGCVLSSPQWVPKAGAEPDEDGNLPAYIVTTVFTQEDKDENGNFIPKPPEFWVFDAWDLKQGPIAKLVCDELQVGFTFHTAWLEEISPWQGAYVVEVPSDTLSRVGLTTSPEARQILQEAIDAWQEVMDERARRVAEWDAR